MPKQISPKVIALTFGILTVSFLAAFYVVAWTEPTEAPPGGNVAPPLNTSDIGQTKSGNLVVNALGISGTGANIFQMPYGAGAGKVLVSDASGNTSWQNTPTGKIGALWIYSYQGNRAYYKHDFLCTDPIESGFHGLSPNVFFNDGSFSWSMETAGSSRGGNFWECSSGDIDLYTFSCAAGYNLIKDETGFYGDAWYLLAACVKQ